MDTTHKVRFIVLIVFSIIFWVLLIGIGFVGNALYNLALNPNAPKDLIFPSKDNSSTTNEKNDTNTTVLSPWQAWLYEESNFYDYYITSRDGLRLHNYIIPHSDSNKWAIVVHGYLSEGKDMAAYAKQFHTMGYHVILPDLRSHGKSDGNYIGMGWDEHFDVLDLVNDIVANHPDSQIVLFGVSMGAATVLNVSGESLPSNVKVVIEDCGYTSIWDELSYQLKIRFHLPSFPMMQAATLVTKIRAGYWFGDGSVVEQVKKSITPTLFIHGDADAFVPYPMLDELYQASTAEKEKLVIQGAVHANSCIVNSELYWSTIQHFLDKYI